MFGPDFHAEHALKTINRMRSMRLKNKILTENTSKESVKGYKKISHSVSGQPRQVLMVLKAWSRNSHDWAPLKGPKHDQIVC